MCDINCVLTNGGSSVAWFNILDCDSRDRRFKSGLSPNYKSIVYTLL